MHRRQTIRHRMPAHHRRAAHTQNSKTTHRQNQAQNDPLKRITFGHHTSQSAPHKRSTQSRDNDHGVRRGGRRWEHDISRFRQSRQVEEPPRKNCCWSAKSHNPSHIGDPGNPATITAVGMARCRTGGMARAGNRGYRRSALAVGWERASRRRCRNGGVQGGEVARRARVRCRDGSASAGWAQQQAENLSNARKEHGRPRAGAGW